MSSLPPKKRTIRNIHATAPPKVFQIIFIQNNDFKIDSKVFLGALLIGSIES